MLTSEDRALAANAGIMLAKNRIIEEVYLLFGRLATHFQQQANALPPEIRSTIPKISKGENYLGLPWVMLDYPRHFSTTDMFAVRTMFWWGHYFSLHLLVQGCYLPLLQSEKLSDKKEEGDWFFSVAPTPWQHHFDEQNVLALSELHAATVEQQIKENGFVKISCKLSVAQWEDAEAYLQKRFSDALQWVQEKK